MGGVAEAAVVPVVDEIKGRTPEIYISLNPGYAPNKEISDKVVVTIETMIGKIARPKKVHIVPDMPKTRSGKIMRRVLAAISNTLDTGDFTTLANPDVVEQILDGMSRACRQAGVALIGGETAEMPGFYADGEYDRPSLAGLVLE